MTFFFLLIEILVPLMAIYLIWVKGDISIVYLPFFLFCGDVIMRTFPALVGYIFNSLLVAYYVYHNPQFVKRNIFAVILIIYFFLLLPFSKDLIAIRPFFFSAIWLFLLIPVLSQIYHKNPRERIFNELSSSAFLILLLFIVNSVLSTLFNFNPRQQYGITSGILYGDLSLDNFNVLPFAAYVVLRKGIRDKNFLYIVVYLAAIFLILLTFRRSVMALCVLGTVVVLIELLDYRKIGDLVLYGSILSLVTLLVVYQTGFLELFWERYEMRGLDDRPLEQEGRMMEFGLLYRDLFVYYDYDPWFGYELFASHGNYGKNLFGNRSLHTDFASIVHSSGFIGLFLYLAMVVYAFGSVWMRTFTKADYLQFFFITIAFFVFAMSGRWYTISATTMMYCLLYLPLCYASKKMKKESQKKQQIKVTKYPLLPTTGSK